MGINPNQINIVDNTGSSAVEGSVILSKNTGDHVWSSNTTGSIKIPSGTTLQRNSAPIEGYLRFNVDSRTVEVYSASAPIGWKNIGQLTVAGSAATPGFSFVQDQATGFFQPLVNQIGLTIGGVQRSLWTAVEHTTSLNTNINATLTVTNLIVTGSSNIGGGTGSVSWADITNKPTTLSGFGITNGQPLDADLTSIAGLTGTSGLLRKTAANTWALDTNSYVNANGSTALTANWNVGGIRTITNVSAPINSTDVATKQYVDSAVASLNTRFRFSFFFTYTPLASEKLSIIVPDSNLTIPANFAGDQFVRVGVNPTSTFVITIRKNGTTTIGTISINTSGVATLATTSGVSQSIVKGDMITFEAPATADPSISDVAVMLWGTIV